MRKLPLLGLLSALSAVFAIPTAMAEPELSAQFSSCMDRSGGVTMAMMDCINAEHRRQDAKLNANYRALSARVSQPRRQQLLDVQRAWIRFRDLNCAFYDDPEGGSAARGAANSCFMEATAARAQELTLLMPPWVMGTFLTLFIKKSQLINVKVIHHSCHL